MLKIIYGKGKENYSVYNVQRNGRKLNSQKSIVYEFGINKTKR
jgi:hypothetical protein